MTSGCLPGGVVLAAVLIGAIRRWWIAAQLAPVLELAPEMRIRTVTGYLESLDRMLTQPRFAGRGLAVTLRQQISEFTSATAAY